LRRGHIRSLPDGRKTWVRDSIINASLMGGKDASDIYGREKYILPKIKNSGLNSKENMVSLEVSKTKITKKKVRFFERFKKFLGVKVDGK
jgi:hypothetical protein